MKITPKLIFSIHKLSWINKKNILNNELMKFSKFCFEHFRKKDFNEFWDCFSSETKFIIFILINKELNDKLYWTFLGDVINSDTYISDYEEAFRFFLNNPKRNQSDRKYMMTDEGYEYLRKTRKRVIYRGCTLGNQKGYSWTFDYKIAKRFAFTHSGDVCIYKGYFSKKNVIAYFSREQEILIDPKNVENFIIESCYTISVPTTNPYKKSQVDNVRKYISDNKLLKNFSKESSDLRL